MTSNSRIIRREKGTKLNLKGNQDDVVDEIALRDEILELKRQVVILKRTNEQNLIKFRKYEDEAKRKDRQIEELMDPRKNADITKFLSVRGAAILMNLKDQNNSLIQMILNKDLQIRRLVGELKTSKLYGASRKTENYRTEINRLRNLLEKSRESIKETIDMQQQQQQQQKLICINEISNMQTSSSSEQSSPRELDDLRFTIQSLETHIKYSNDLLAKKNLEILTLNDELNSLRKFSQCKTCHKLSKSNFINDDLRFIEKIEGLESPNSHRFKSRTKLEKTVGNAGDSGTDKQFSELFERTMRLAEDRKKSNSAPASSLRWSSFSDQSFERENPVSESNEIRAEFKSEENVILRKPNPLENSEEKNRDEMLCAQMRLGGDDDSGNRIQREGKKSGKKGKEKWINSFVVTKQFKRKNARKNSAIQRKSRKKINRTKERISDFEMEKMKEEGNREENEKGFKGKASAEMNRPTFVKPEAKEELQSNNGSLNRAKEEKRPKENGSSHSSKIPQPSENETSIDEDQIQGKDCGKEKIEATEKETEENDSTDSIKKEITNISSNFSPEIQRELKNLYENITIYEEIEMKKVKTRREIYEQNFDSSFDSDNGYQSKQEPQSVQVEVEINSLPFPPESFQFDGTPEKSDVRFEESLPPAEENDFPDDDDVIIRQKNFHMNY